MLVVKALFLAVCISYWVAAVDAPQLQSILEEVPLQYGVPPMAPGIAHHPQPKDSTDAVAGLQSFATTLQLPFDAITLTRPQKSVFAAWFVEVKERSEERRVGKECRSRW